MSLERLLRALSRGRSWAEALLVGVTGALVLVRPGGAALLAPLVVLMAGLAVRSRIAKEPGVPWALGLEAAGVAFAVFSPRAGLVLVGLVSAVRALPGWREAEPSVLASAAARRVVGGIAIAALSGSGARPSIALVLMMLVLLLEAYGPGAVWTREGAGRRAAGFTLATALALLEGREGRLGIPAAEVLAFALSVVALARLAVVVGRLAAGEELASLEALARRAGDLGDGRGRVLAHLASVALCGLLALHAGALRVRDERPILPEELISNGGHSFLLPAAIPGSDAWGGSSSLEILENGRPLPSGHMPHDQIRDLGSGRFSHWHGVVHLSSSDGTDPRANGRRYVVSFDACPGYATSFFVVLGWCLLASRGLARRLQGAVHAGTPPARVRALVGTGLLLLAVAVVDRALPERRSRVVFEPGLAPEIRAAVEERERRLVVSRNAGFSSDQPLRFVAGPVSVDLLPVAAAAFGLAACASVSAFAPWLGTRGPSWGALSLVVVAFGYRLIGALRVAQEGLFGYLLKGVPFSDANGWSTLAREFSLGERWDQAWVGWGARRPLYYIVFGPCLTFTGPSVVALQAGSLILSALTVGFIFDLVRRLASTPVALVAALGQALFLLDARISLLTATESLGAFLTVVALWLLVRSGERLAVGLPARALAAASGAVFALANLARPLNLQALAVLPVALALVVPRGATRPRALLTTTAAFWLGASGALGPWIARQRIVHGIWTISENTAEMTFAATSPRYGTWSGAVSALAAGRSLQDRVAFYNEATSRNLREHMGWYVRHVLDYAGQITRELGMPNWLLATAVVVFAVAAFGRRPPPQAIRRVAFLAVTLILFCAFSPPLLGGRALLIFGVAFVLLRRDALLLVATLAAATLAGMAALATTEPRFLSTLQWPAAALGAHALAQIFERAVHGHWLERPWLVGEAAPGWGSAAKLLRILACVFAALFAVGVVRVVARNLSPSSPPVRPVRLDLAESRPWVEAALEDGVFTPLGDRVEVWRTRLLRDHVATFEAGELVPGWEYEIGAPRAYGYALFGMRPRSFAAFAVFPLDPRPLAGPGDEDLVLVGIRVSHEGVGETFEVVALGVARAGPGGLVRPAVDIATLHAAQVRRFLAR